MTKRAKCNFLSDSFAYEKLPLMNYSPAAKSDGDCQSDLCGQLKWALFLAPPPLCPANRSLSLLPYFLQHGVSPSKLVVAVGKSNSRVKNNTPGGLSSIVL